MGTNQKLCRCRSGVTLLELIVVTGIMSFALLGTLKAVSVTRGLNDRAEILTRLTLRAHAELETRKALPFEQINPGATPLTGFDDPRTTGVVTIERLPDAPGLRIAVELVGRTHRGEHAVYLAVRRFPEGQP